MKHSINMKSKAMKVKGQGVGSAYEEQVSLVYENLGHKFNVYENKNMFADITHYHTINLGYFLGLPFTKVRGKTVGYVHFLPETVDKSLKLASIFRVPFYKYIIAFYKQMDYLVTVNPYFIDRLASYGVNPDKVTYIPNFVDEKRFHKIKREEISLLKEKYKIPEDKFVVFCAGQLQKRKGIFDFIEVAKKMPDIHFVWAGGFSFGRITDGYKELQEMVNNPPFNLQFLGIVEREDMNGLYNIGNVMFLPSFEELFPMTILEAMNCGKPLLLRDIEIYENILFDFYLRAASVDGFVSEIRRLEQDRKYYQQAVALSEKGHRFYSKANVCKMWDTFYSKVALASQEKKKKKVYVIK